MLDGTALPESTPTQPPAHPMNPRAWRITAYIIGGIGAAGTLVIGGLFLDGEPGPPILEHLLLTSLTLLLSGVGFLAASCAAEDRRAREAGIRADLGAVMVAVRRMEEQAADSDNDAYWRGFAACARELTSKGDGSVVPLPTGRQRANGQPG